jgi:chorismate mutase
MADADSKTATTPSLQALRARLDAIDAELLPLIDERATLAKQVAAAKAASGDAGRFGLRPGRETAILRKRLAHPRKGAGDALVVRLWREIMSDNLAQQGPFALTVWGGRDPVRIAELARQRFGGAPSMTLVEKPEAALAAARALGGVAILPLAPESAWWGRLLAEPRLKVFATLPCLAAWGPLTALAVADVEVEPTGGDNTFWVTDAPATPDAIEGALARDGVAASFMIATGGLKLFSLAGFYQANDERLARAPGSLSGVIGAAPTPLDV